MFTNTENTSKLVLYNQGLMVANVSKLWIDIALQAGVTVSVY